MTEPKGATAADWFHFEFVLGLGGNLLPCVPAGPDVKVAKDSQLADKVGKIPSMFNRAGEAHGISGWQKRPILSNELQHWSQDSRLNICVRTGPISGVYAIDIDVDDVEKSAAIVHLIESMLGLMPKRYRENSGKCLLMFRLEKS
jgi:hypothetical protein